ncbi:HisA/HisF-related TIM barrel protein [Piscinibacter sp.]|jgi:phosphoribosylformimino-5-aminoimidazole carboxamide ribotide isomerase|uniref:HisA/HisF-related TIM barrel protein n=1 Tax=Piscinibacter sp. TaxID=1903157 RepID=UPI002DF8F4C9|nr:HisA/HisF-related TIM barrel protein [Burkholderiaceae bacterium]
MSIIPVIDLLGGQVVRAVRGDRLAYQPIESALSRSADPRVVARVLCEYTASRVLYVADLDALLGRAPQVDLVTELLEELPDMLLWLDAGFRDRASADVQLAVLGSVAARVEPVFGSESLASRPAFEQCFAEGASGLLSLDRRGSQPLDPSGCWDLPSLWPRKLIVMTLDRVGADLGPDLQTLAEVRQRAREGTLLIGAGGIRHAADLAAAREAGADAWLVASALHDLKLPRAA